MFLLTFDNTHANKHKHPIKLCAGLSYYTLIEHLRNTYRKLHQLNISNLLSKMASYFNINKGFTKYLEKMKEAQKTASTIDSDLINDVRLN